MRIKMLFLVLLFFLLSDIASAAEALYGAGAYTGNPIGGGAGYSNIVITGDYVVSTRTEFLNALSALKAMSASARSGKIIYITGTANIDLTGMTQEGSDYFVSIPSGIIIASNRGYGGSPGGRIYITDKSKRYIALFRIAGDAVTFNGIRLEGPDQTVGSPSVAPFMTGIRNGLGGTGYKDLVVENCEIYGWPFAGIEDFSDGVNGINNPGHFYIHHNYFHHNQREGVGYGVVTGLSSGIIEANYFDYQRHHIAGSEGANYIETRYNIFGPNGPDNSMYDNHGGSDTTAGGYGLHETCEIDVPAGGLLLVHHNTFQSSTRTTAGIRGIPAVKAEFYNNWDYHSEPATTEGLTYIWHQRLVTCIGETVDGILITSSNQRGYIRMYVHDNWYGTSAPSDSGSTTTTGSSTISTSTIYTTSIRTTSTIEASTSTPMTTSTISRVTSTIYAISGGGGGGIGSSSTATQENVKISIAGFSVELDYNLVEWMKIASVVALGLMILMIYRKIKH